MIEDHIYEDPDLIIDVYRPPLPNRNIKATENPSYDRAFELMPNESYTNSSELTPDAYESSSIHNPPK